MPTYQYRCTECGEDLEAVQKFSDPALTTCPTCGGRLRKVYNAVGVVFKGSGFYRTDSRTEATAGAGASNGGTKGGTNGTNGSSSTSESSTKEPATTTSGGVESSATPSSTPAGSTSAA